MLYDGDRSISRELANSAKYSLAVSAAAWIFTKDAQSAIWNVRLHGIAFGSDEEAVLAERAATDQLPFEIRIVGKISVERFVRGIRRCAEIQQRKRIHIRNDSRCSSANSI